MKSWFPAPLINASRWAGTIAFDLIQREVHPREPRTHRSYTGNTVLLYCSGPQASRQRTPQPASPTASRLPLAAVHYHAGSGTHYTGPPASSVLYPLRVFPVPISLNLNPCAIRARKWSHQASSDSRTIQRLFDHSNRNLESLRASSTNQRVYE